MSWLKRNARLKLTPGEIASTLLRAFVTDISKSEKAEAYDVPPRLGFAFHDRSKLYREALICLVLESRSKSESECERILHEFQALILPSSSTPGATARVNELNSATQDLFRLLNPSENRVAISWSSEWFSAIHFDQFNPATLAMFSHYWLQSYITLNKTITELVRID